MDREQVVKMLREALVLGYKLGAVYHADPYLPEDVAPMYDPELNAIIDRDPDVTALLGE